MKASFIGTYQSSDATLPPLELPGDNRHAEHFLLHTFSSARLGLTDFRPPKLLLHLWVS